MTLTLPQGSVLFFDTSSTGTTAYTKLSEHNRQPVQLNPIRIEKTSRMANGFLRKIFVADKQSFSTSWVMLPSYSTMTVDGGMGAEDIRTFYANKGTGSFKIKIAYSSTRTEEMTVVFTSFSASINKRNVKAKTTDTAQEFWDVNFTLEQV